ncbi:MAG: heavy-metal-associated domain-containing protein [Planctomycetes bacterium]|nr:heavy-metal-associated domain-containing protein [Planctomycetota bacterium]
MITLRALRAPCLALTVVLVVPTLLATALAGCSREPAAPSAAATLELRVEGMTCSACELTICGALTALPGVTSCAASQPDSKVTVVYEPGKTNPAQITAAIRATGYEVPSTP